MCINWENALKILLILYYVGAGAYSGCTYCTQKGEYCKSLQKIVYLGNRCFLEENDVLRTDTTKFPAKKKISSPPPEMKTTEYVDKANDKYCAAETTQERTKIFQDTGCKGTYALRKLGCHERILNTPVDPMQRI